jgi:hypothetical protein
MATEVQKRSAQKRENNFPKIRPSYYNSARHQNDEFKNLGYDYTGKILRKTTSPELWSNPLQTSFYERIEGILNFLVEQVKYIKKTFSIAHEKESIKIQ